MNIFFESPQRLKIELSGTDLSELGITYDELDYSKERTRNVVHELLHRIGAENEFDPSDKMLIEIFPRADDGCTMYFTSMHQSSLAVRRRHSRSEVSVWEFAGADELMDALNCYGNISAIKYGLYELNGRYRLILNERPEGKLGALLNEFATKCGQRNEALYTVEHGILLRRSG